MGVLKSSIDSIEEVTPSKNFSNARIIDPPEAGSPNGGYLAKLLLQASAARYDLDHFAPRVVTVQFISPSRFEPMEIATEVLRRGGNTCFISAKMHQAGQIRVVGQLCYGRSEEGPYHQPYKMPEALPPEYCLKAQLPGFIWPHFSQQCEYRIAHSPGAFSGAERAEMLCWIRMRSMVLDRHNLLFLFDSAIPAFFLAARFPYQTVTTDFHVEYSDRFCEQSCGKWVLVSVRVREWAGRWCIEDAEAWSANGLLLAVARQLRFVFPAVKSCIP